MKRIARPIVSATQFNQYNCVFTTQEVVELLSEINELNGLKISTSMSENNNLQFVIGDTAYEVTNK